MNTEFLTQGLERDRYLKSLQLIDRFETELRRELERAGKQIVSENNDLFVGEGDPSWLKRRSHSSVLAHQRIDYTMSRVESSGDDPSNLVLNLGFRWVEPGKFGLDGNGALTITSYRIKNGSDEEYHNVMQATRNGDWDVCIADDPFGSYPATFYVPVETAEDVRDGYDLLSTHFEEFATMFGVEP